MIKAIVLVSALVGWAQAGDLYDSNQPVVLSSGTRTVGITSTGKLPVQNFGIGESGSDVVPTVSNYGGYSKLQTVAYHPASRLVYQGKLFGVVNELTISGSAENNILLFVNLSTNTMVANIERIIYNFHDNNASGTIRVYQDAVVTSSGTTLQIVSRNISTTTYTSQMQAYSIPVTSSLGKKIVVASSGRGSTGNALEGGVLVAPGKTLLFTSQPSGSGFQSAVTLVWGEEPQ